jgi:4-amino-4-deoxy-L-arabinose transferase-like glycosyltransferase
MAEWLAVPIIIFSCFLPGRLLISSFAADGRNFPGGLLAFNFAAFAAGVLTVGWLAFLLAELGLYSLLRLALLWLTLSLILLWYSRRSRGVQLPNPIAEQDAQPSLSKLPFLEPALLLIWLVVAVWLFFRPHEFIIGGADAGVYVNLAINIANDGRILIHDPILDNLPPALYPALLRELPPTENASVIASYYALPGFYITDAQAGQITPQFFHLHPVWQAISHSLGGVRATLLTTGLWALGGSLALFFLARQLVSKTAAFLALAVITISALQVWFARYPTTEPLTQFLLWTGVWTLTLWLKAIKENKPEEKRLTSLLGLLAGLTLGQVFLTRIDMYFLLVVPAVLFLWLRQDGRWQSNFNWFFLPLALMTLHSMIHALWQSLPYAYNLFAYGLILIRRNWLIPVAALLVAIVVLTFFGRFTHQLEKLTRYRKPILITAIIGLVLLALYGWFLRPYLGQTTVRPDWFGGAALPRTDHENLLRLGWYLSPVGIALSVVGICLMLWRINRQTAVILTVGLLFSLLYLWRIQANPHQIYASRRYVPVTLPFAIFAGAYLLNALSNLDIGRLKRPYAMSLAAILALIWLAATGLSARGFISQVDYRGLISQISDLNDQLDPNSILVFNGDSAVTTGDIIGTPLQYLFGHSVYGRPRPAPCT